MIRIQFWGNSQKVAVLRARLVGAAGILMTLKLQQANIDGKGYKSIFVWSWINTNEIKWRISLGTIDASMTFICCTGDADMSAHATWPQGWLGYRFDVGWDQVPYIAWGASLMYWGHYVTICLVAVSQRCCWLWSPSHMGCEACTKFIEAGEKPVYIGFWASKKDAKLILNDVEFRWGWVKMGQDWRWFQREQCALHLP